MENKSENNPRCATPFMDSIRACWKQAANPYDNPDYQIPTCMREKIVPNAPFKSISCATLAMETLHKAEDRLG